jgi:hypothetical protein
MMAWVLGAGKIARGIFDRGCRRKARRVQTAKRSEAPANENHEKVMESNGAFIGGASIIHASKIIAAIQSSKASEYSAPPAEPYNLMLQGVNPQAGCTSSVAVSAAADAP